MTTIDLLKIGVTLAVGISFGAWYRHRRAQGIYRANQLLIGELAKSVVALEEHRDTVNDTLGKFNVRLLRQAATLGEWDKLLRIAGGDEIDDRDSDPIAVATLPLQVNKPGTNEPVSSSWTEEDRRRHAELWFGKDLSDKREC